MGKLLVDSLNLSYDVGELSNSQKQAIITLLEKKDKDKRKINNWRPISLVNLDAKIASKAIALRLQSILPRIIHHNQNAYVKERNIFDAIRTIDDVLEYTKRRKIDGRMIAIDFKKAFDSVNRNFLNKTLQAFNFGPSFIRWVSTLYKNISSCVLNNGFATAPFQVQRGVRQGDPLSPYLFIIVIELFAISIRSDRGIEGIKVDNEEVKVEMFADDLTAFLRNDHSLRKFLDKTEDFGVCSGLCINYDKTEILFLGNPIPILEHYDEFRKIKVKRAVKILGVFFTYDKSLHQKLNFAEIIDSIKGKIKMWKWRNLTILGRIQIVKTFIVPIFMYRAGLISLDKEVIKEADSIIFDFIWKGKDKVKRSSLVSEIETGGLKAPHLESIIKTQRIMCCKKFAGDNPSGWKYFLSYYLKPVGGKFVLCCDFDLKMLPVNLPNYYKECLECFAECSTANVTNVNNLTHEQIARTVIWNNKFVNIEGKSVFNGKLVRQGIVTVFDLVTKQNRFVGINNILEANLSPIDMFELMSIADALPLNWRQSIKENNNILNTAVSSDLQSQIGLYILGNKVLISKVSSKSISKELRSKVTASPTAQAKYTELFENDNLEWNEIYSLPFKVALDTRTREFQYRILNRYLVTNSFLQKIGKIDSSMCSFCNAEAESLEHLFLSCPIINPLWANLIVWCNSKNIQIKSLSDVDKMFGI